MYPEVAPRCGNCHVMLGGDDLVRYRTRSGVGWAICTTCITTFRKLGLWCELHGPTSGRCLACQAERRDDMEAAYRTGFEAGQRVRAERPDCTSWEVAYAGNVLALSQKLSMVEDATQMYRAGFRAGWDAAGAAAPEPVHKYVVDIDEIPHLVRADLWDGGDGEFDICHHCGGSGECWFCRNHGVLPICQVHEMPLTRGQGKEQNIMFCEMCDRGDPPAE